MSYRQTFSPHWAALIFTILALNTASVQAGVSAPPDVVLTPASVSLQLRQGESISRTFTLQNKGASPLNWTASLSGSPAWAGLSAESGLVPPKASQAVKVTLDAGQLAAGTYTATFTVASNDPDSPVIERPITLKVIAAPVAVFEPEALEFESTFVNARRRSSVTVTNGGEAPLSITGALPLSPTFVCVEKLPIKLAPGASREIAIEFRPSSEGRFSGNVVLLDNTARRYSFVPVSGVAIYGPALKVTPASVSLTLNPGVVKQQTLELSNITKGEASLEWQAEIEAHQEIPWINLETTSGTIGSEEDPAQLLVNIDTSGVEAGSYAVKVLIRSNDPMRPEVRVSLTVRVNKAAALSVNPSSLNFPNASMGKAENFTLVVTNSGNVTLVISNVLRSDQQIIHGFVEEKTLLRGESWNLGVRYTPEQMGPYAGTLTLQTTDKKINSVVVPITANVVRPAAIAVSPGSLNVSVVAGQTVDRALTVDNSGEATLTWNAALQNVSPAVSAQGSLGQVLDRLNTQPGLITAAISNSFSFTGGDTGSSIANGGSNMYNTGNKIGTNLAASMPYSDGVIAPHAGLGTNGAYFTRKRPGIFVFAADMSGVTRFTVSGNLGANGQGTASGAVLSRTVAGVTYKGFFKRVYGATVPSVNHLMITVDTPTVSHFVSTDTNIDRHDLDGIYSASTRVYYVLFSTQNGGFVSDAAAAEVMRIFLESYVHPATTGWVSINHTSGSTNGGTSSTETVSFNAASVIPGNYTANLRFTSNALVASTVNVPITLQVTAAAVSATSAQQGPPGAGAASVNALPDSGGDDDAETDEGHALVASVQAKLGADFAASLASLLPSSGGDAEGSGSNSSAALSIAGSGLVIDLNGDGIADVSNFARNTVVQSSEPGVVVQVLSYTRRTGLDDTALILEASQDGGQNWLRLVAKLDYTVASVTAFIEGVSETVELHFPVTAGTTWRFRLVGALEQK